MATTPLATRKPDAAFVEGKLRRAWRKERRFYHANGLAHFLVWAVALVLVDWLVDWLFLIPGYGRVLLLAVNAGALGWVLYRYWVRYLRRYNPVRTALQVERQHPELQSLLVSFVQLGHGEAAGYASPALVRALQRQAVEATRPLDFREIVSFRELQRIFLLCAGVVVFFGAISINWAEHLRVLADRMFNPQSSEPYPTRTHIEWITGSLSPQQGDAVTLAVRGGGVLPESGSLYVRPKDGSWERLLMPRADEQVFDYRFPEVYQAFDYYVRLGDAVSEEYQVKVVPPPRVVDTRVRLTYPPYTGRKAETVDMLNFEVPEGSHIAWELRFDVPLARAETIIEETARTPLGLSADGRVATIAMTPAESFSYQFRWIEREHGYVYDDDVRYFVQVIPDAEPQVEIVKPLEDEKATVRKTLAIEYQARDDYGLTRAWIVYSVNEGEEKKLPLATFDKAAVEEKASWKLADSIPGLKEGDVVACAIEVADNHTGDQGPFIARSQTRKVYIVSVPEYLAYMLEKRKKLVGDIRTMHQQEEEASTQVGDLKETPVPKPEAPPDAKE